MRKLQVGQCWHAPRQRRQPSTTEFDCGLLTGFALALLIVAAFYALLPIPWANLAMGVFSMALFGCFVGRFIKSGEA